MNVFLIPLQERISLSLLHPSSRPLFLSLSSSLISESFFLSLSKSTFCLLHFVFFIVMLIITFPEYACLTFIDLAVLITFSISFLYLSIYILFSISMLDKSLSSLICYYIFYQLIYDISYLSLFSYFFFLFL